MSIYRSIQRIDWRRHLPVAGGVLALLLVTLMVVPGMGVNSLRHDEVLAVLSARAVQTPFDLFQIDANPSRVVHPPMIFALLRLWMTLVGQTDTALRALPALGALITAAFLYRAAVDLSGQAAAGFAAAVVFGGMDFARYYIHETQSYGFLMTGAALALFFYYRWWTRRRLRYAVGLTTALLFLVYTYYGSIYLILALTLHVLVTGGYQIRRWFMISVTALLGYVPWLPALFWTMLLYPYSAQQTNIARSTPSTLDGLGFTLRVLLYNGWPYYAIAFGLVALAVAVAALRSHPQLLRKISFLVIVAAGGLLLPMLGNFVVQIFTPHRVIYLLVVFALILGYGFSLLPARWRWVGLGALLVLTYNQPLPAFMPGNWLYRQAMETLAGHVRPGDGVYIDFSDTLDNLPLRYYGEQFLRPGTPVHAASEPEAALLNAYLPLNRIWVIRRQTASDPALWLQSPLQVKRLAETEAYTLAFYRISLYSAPAGRPTPSLAYVNPAGLPLPQSLEGQIELIGYEVDKLDLRPGDRITVNLDWRATQPLKQDWAIYLHLVQADFVTLRGQGDGNPNFLGIGLSTLYWPAGAIIYDQQTLTVSADTPPGVYFLRLGLYSRQTGERLHIQPGDGMSANDGLVVAKIQVH